MSRSVTFRPRARRDVLDQMLYLEEQTNEEMALRYYDAVLATCGVLAQQPLMGQASPVAVAGLEQLRRFPVSAPFAKHLIFYQPVAPGIEVVRVLYGPRDIKWILLTETDE